MQALSPMPQLPALKNIRNLNGIVSPLTSLTPLKEPDREFLAEEFSADVAEAPQPEDLQAQVVKIHKNTNQKLIIVTHDKTLLCLKRNLSRLGKAEWIAPLSTVMTIILALITADFRGAFGLGSAEWKAMFVISAFIATGWLAQTLRKSLKSLSMNEVIYNTVEQLGGEVNA